MKWLWQLLRDPSVALDWHNAQGEGLDHGKVVADLVIFVLLGCVVMASAVTQTYPPVAWGITLIAGAMGSRVFIAFLKSRAVTSQEQVRAGTGWPDDDIRPPGGQGG